MMYLLSCHHNQQTINSLMAETSEEKTLTKAGKV